MYEEIEQIAALLYNPFAALLLVLVTGLRGDWVFGWIYRERMAQLEMSRDAWMEDAKQWRAACERCEERSRAKRA